MSGEKNCERCNHPEDPHLVVATTENEPLKGGVILCHVKGCDCYATWNVDQFYDKEEMFIPTEIELAQLRAQLQHTEP